MKYKSGYQFEEHEGKLIGQFTAWLEKLLLHGRIDYIRRNKYMRKEIPMEEFPRLSYENYDPVVLTNSEDFEFEEKRLEKAFQELPLMRQEILKMLFVEELSATEIAERLNCTVQHVYNVRSQAIKKFRKALEEEGERNV